MVNDLIECQWLVVTKVILSTEALALISVKQQANKTVPIQLQDVYC